jgi:chromate transporter
MTRAGDSPEPPDAPTPPTARLAPTRGREDVVPFGEAVRTWFAISLQTFGGPAGQIAVMQHTLVEENAGSASAASCTR